MLSIEILFTIVLFIISFILPIIFTDINVYGPMLVWIMALYLFWITLKSPFDPHLIFVCIVGLSCSLFITTISF